MKVNFNSTQVKIAVDPICLNHASLINVKQALLEVLFIPFFIPHDRAVLILLVELELDEPLF